MLCELEVRWWLGVLVGSVDHARKVPDVFVSVKVHMPHVILRVVLAAGGRGHGVRPLLALCYNIFWVIGLRPGHRSIPF